MTHPGGLEWVMPHPLKGPVRLLRLLRLLERQYGLIQLNCRFKLRPVNMYCLSGL